MVLIHADEYPKGDRLERELGVLRRQVQTMDEFIRLSCEKDAERDAYVEKTFDKAWKRMNNQRKDLERMHKYEGELGDRLNEVEDLGVAFDRKFDVFEQRLCRCDRPIPPQLSGTGTADEPFVLGSELSYAGTPEPEGPAVASGSSSSGSYHSPPVATPNNSDHDVPLPLPTLRTPLADITGCCR